MTDPVPPPPAPAPRRAVRRSRSFGRRLLQPLLTGLLVLLPLALTLAVLGWLLGVLNHYLGPASPVGRAFAAPGTLLFETPALAYLFGAVLLVAATWLLGVVVRTRVGPPLRAWFDRAIRRVPLLGSLYGVADRFVGVLDHKPGADMGAMSPVWCFFGGAGVAVLALAPNPRPVSIDGRPYRAVLVPTAPVPFGGALLYVPVEWVKPAEIGFDTLTAIYVSMGITPPPTPRH